MSIAPRSIKNGELFAGRYLIDRVLGSGAMGTVVAARHITHGRRVAIKCLLPEHRESRSLVARFQREARATSRLNNEHVARVLDSGEVRFADDEPPILYLVMDQLEGSDLRAMLSSSGPVPVRWAADYVSQACEGLAEAHALGIVHRDLKPANLFRTVTPEGRSLIKVLDFGIARFESPNASGDRLDVTEHAAMMGTMQYMAPEQMLDARTVDARADVWSLGVILYELCTGKKPFPGEATSDIAFQVLAGDATPLRQHLPYAPEGFEALVMRCLDRRREARPGSVVELARLLSPFTQRRPSMGPSILTSTAPLSTRFTAEMRAALRSGDPGAWDAVEEAEPPTRRFAPA